ncbi:MAG: hypothetical protein ACTTKL_04085 [Treponema sp.]
MIQFYLLSVLLNLLAGFYMFFFSGAAEDSDIPPLDSDDGIDFDGEDKSGADKNIFSRIFGLSHGDDKLFRLVVGGLSFLTAMIKLFSPVRGVVIIGDFLPAAAGLAAAASILLGYYMNEISSSVTLPPLIQKIFIEEQKFIGLFCAAAALLHFLFPYAAVL